MVHNVIKSTEDKNHSFDVVITGAGPAGLFCAIRCAEYGLSVVVLEKNRTAGRKLLISGSGRCNLTHAGSMEVFLEHYGDKGRFVKPALLSFTNLDLDAYFKARGLPLEEMPGGKVFPATQDARDVLRALMDGCARLEVKMRFGENVLGVVRKEHGFSVSTGTGSYDGKAFVIATGGRSYPATGSTGDGYRFAVDMGHSIEETAPALTPVIVNNYSYEDCAGISLENVPILLCRDGKKQCSHHGDVLFTHRGLSGPGILDLSRRIQPGDNLIIAIAAADRHELDAFLSDAAAHHGKKLLRTVLCSRGVPERLVGAVLRSSGVRHDTVMSRLDRTARRTIAELFSGLPFEVKGLGGYGEAMVTRGGISTVGINRLTMESRTVPGLFFAGEVIDVDGDTGGYNIQFAFSSGALAAAGIARRLRAVSPEKINVAEES